MRKIILASGSPRRKEILGRLGIPFEVVQSDFQEFIDPKISPGALAEKLAIGKAKAVAFKYPDAIIIGADTVVALHGEAMGKPKTPEEAVAMLTRLSGETHSVFTGFTIMSTKTGRSITDVCESKVTFKQLDPASIEKYVISGEPLEMAGGYAIQSGAKDFVEKYEGDYNNIVGLPLTLVRNALKMFDVSVSS
ncbi:MAG: Maf family protein [Candidatus Pacebacteria bacterium]|nr:Maf family protein [Candidatus Paceibacterota bacterium]MDD5356937.1 Maf family protein [Candidatus Paceibacterota bacterium]